MADGERRIRIEQAVRFLIERPDTSYGTAAAIYRVKINAIRSRIEHRYGSLAAARETGWQPTRANMEIRACMICKTPKEMDRNQRICDKCKREIDTVHDGPV